MTERARTLIVGASGPLRNPGRGAARVSLGEGDCWDVVAAEYAIWPFAVRMIYIISTYWVSVGSRKAVRVELTQGLSTSVLCHASKAMAV